MNMRTPITYYGGKQRLAKTIVSMIPSHKIYCEPFFGGGAVFFQKPKAGIEVINDKNDMLINFYLCIQNRFEELQKKYNPRYTPKLCIIKLKIFGTAVSKLLK